MNRIQIIQGLIDKNNYKSYLEIGVREGACFNAIKCNIKVGVDPDTGSAATKFMTSDDYFASIPWDAKFDIVFIDGLHHADQVEVDIINSLAHLNERGTIVMHDCLPTSEFMQLIPMRPDHNEWTGDTWKAFVKLRATKTNLTMHVVDTDWGCGIIRPGEQVCIHLDREPEYQDFVKNKTHWMNMISIGGFKQLYL
jgi:hypothetical protein